MGLSIHYSGSFNKNSSLPEMIEEVKDIAEIYQWEYTIFEEQFPSKSFGEISFNQNIYGICFSPPNCETIWLCFLSNGKMSSPMHLEFFSNPRNEDERQYLYSLSTKTQYAGINIHKLIIHLLKYLSEKYFQNFTLNDEGEYWETGDEQLLQENFNRYNELMQTVSSALENIPMKTDETFEKYFERILKQIHIRKKHGR